MNFVLKVSETGHLDLPENVRISMGLEHGGQVSAWVEEGELRIRPLASVLDDLQEEASKILAGDSVDRFLADRRRDEARE